jgi:hypothetical protein
MTGAFKICADHAFTRTICEDRHVLRSANEEEGRRPDLTILNAPHQNGRPLLLDISIVQAFQRLTTTSILKLVNSSETWLNKLTFIAIFPGIICICFTYLSSLYHSNLPSTALYLLILLPYTLPLRYPPTSLMLILPLHTFTLRVSVGYPLHVLSTVPNHF